MFLRRHKAACARRVAEGWSDGWKGGREGWLKVSGASRGWSNERCCWAGSYEGGGSKVRRGQAGGMAAGPPCVLVPLYGSLFRGQHLQPALHAKHTLWRGRLHMRLRGPEEKHSWGCAGREGRWGSSAASLQAMSLPDQAMGDAVMKDERINSLQIILILALKLLSVYSPWYCFVLKRRCFDTRPDIGIATSTQCCMIT